MTGQEREDARNGSGMDGVAARIGRLTALEDGWMDGSGLAPTARSGASMTAALTAMGPGTGGRALISPWADGGLEAEWESSDVTLSARPDGDVIVYDLAAEADGTDEGERRFSIPAAAGRWALERMGGAGREGRP